MAGIKILYCVSREFQFRDEKMPTKKQIEEGWVELPAWVVENLMEDGMNLLGPTGKGPMEAVFHRMNSYATNPLAGEYPNRIDCYEEGEEPKLLDNPRIGQEWMAENNVHHTSMSVGDIVWIDGYGEEEGFEPSCNGHYYCMNRGFQKVETEHGYITLWT
jgi:hypothetical protein